MEDDKNIDIFNKYTGEILKLLYENFPVCYDLNISDIINNTSIKTTYAQDKIELICSETVYWLRDSGFITFAQPQEKLHSIMRYEATPQFMCVILTAKGLEILKQTPDSIKPKETLGDKLVEAVSKNASTVVSDIVSTAISGSIKFL